MDNSDIKILLVDDEEDVLEFLKYNIKKEGYKVKVAQNGAEGIKKALNFSPHLIILDVMMPEMDGIETCSELRKNTQFKDTIIVFLTARHEDYSQIAAFDVGADDYINKPIKPRLLLSKLSSLLRRIKLEDKKQNISLSGIELDIERHIVKYKNEELNLPKKEFKLLRLLMSKPGRVFTREEILTQVWGTDTIVVDRTIDVHIRKLREKLGNSNFVTIKGVGYKFGK